MNNYEEIFKQLKAIYGKGIICIEEVPDSAIKRINPNTNFGFTGAIEENNKITKIDILIDLHLNYEEKVCILFHELGHANYYLKLGWNEIQKRKQQDDYLWTISDEYEAFRNELLEVLKLSKDDDKEILSNLLKRLEDRIVHEVSIGHKEALVKIKSAQIWQQCQEYLNSNHNE